ncbi:MAG: hypothetical protein AB1416_07135 [Actinomycetota bacterium]
MDALTALRGERARAALAGAGDHLVRVVAHLDELATAMSCLEDSPVWRVVAQQVILASERVQEAARAVGVVDGVADGRLVVARVGQG